MSTKDLLQSLRRGVNCIGESADNSTEAQMIVSAESESIENPCESITMPNKDTDIAHAPDKEDGGALDMPQKVNKDNDLNRTAANPKAKANITNKGSKKGKQPDSQQSKNVVDKQAKSLDNIQAQIDALTSKISPVIDFISQMVESEMADEDVDSNDPEPLEEIHNNNSEEGEIIEPVAPATSHTKLQEDPKDSNLSMLHKLSQNLKTKEKIDPPVSDELASIVNDLMSNGVSEETLKDQKEKHNRPENCTYLTVPKVNEEIWHHANEDFRSKDIKLQRIQHNLVKGTTVIVQLMNKTLAAVQNNVAVSRSELLDGFSDAISLLTSANYEINTRRKELWKPEVDLTYKSLCTANKPVTTFLFGDNLSQKVKEMTDAKKVHSNIYNNRSYTRGNRTHPYANRPFLGRGMWRQRPQNMAQVFKQSFRRQRGNYGNNYRQTPNAKRRPNQK